MSGSKQPYLQSNLTDNLTHNPTEVDETNKISERPESEDDSIDSLSFSVKPKRKLKESKKEEFEAPDEPYESHFINKPIEASDIEKTKLIQDANMDDIMVVVGYDGKEHHLVSLGTQTEWTLPEEINIAQSSRMRSSKSSIGSGGEVKPGTPKQTTKSLSKKTSKPPTSAHSQKSSKSKASVRSGKSVGSTDTTTSALLKTQLIVPPYPEEKDEEDDEYGLPIYVSDEESEFSFGEEEASRPPPDGSVDPESLLDRRMKAADDGLVAEIGPPAALQYHRESKLRQILPEINAEDQEKAASEAAKRVLASQETGARCEFCGKEVTALKSLDDQESKPPSEQFCCPEYRELLQFALTHPLNQTKQELIDIRPSGSHPLLQQLVKKRERKPRQEKTVSKKPTRLPPPVASSHMPPARGLSRADGASEGKLARQIKTINYQLSNLKCLEDGWTLREPAELCEDPEQPMFIIDFEGIDAMAEALGFAPRESGQGVINKYYPDGAKFLTLFSDGSGNIFYPSGNLAIMLSRGVDLGHATYVIHQDTSEWGASPLAVLDSSGKGTFFYENGEIRVWYDQLTGVELDSKSDRRKHWFWDGEPHLHAPPFQPICFAVNRMIGVRISSRQHIMLSFVSNSRQCRLNAGSKLKLLNPNSISVALSTMKAHSAELDRLKSYARSLIKQSNESSRNPQASRLSRLSLQQSPRHLKSQKLESFIGASKRESIRSSLLPPLEEKFQ